MRVIVTDRNGYWLQDLHVSERDRASAQKALFAKYNGNCYFFGAEPSESKSTGPLRRAVSPRKFVMVTE